MNKEEIIKNFLQEKHNAEVLIIVGSRAVGDYKPNSDWDIYLFTNEIIKEEEPNQFYNSLPDKIKNEDLDIYKYNFNETFPGKLYRDLRNSKIILDNKDCFGEKIVNKAVELYNKGPNKWSKSYAQGRYYKAQRYMKKFRDNLKDENYEELFLRISWHYSENIIDWWFGIRQEFELRPQQAFDYIKEQDPIFHKELQVVVSDKNSYEDKINAFENIHKILFDKQEYRDLVK